MDKGQYSYTIKELPRNERPREKLLQHGAGQLSNAELMALIIGTGSRERTAVELSRDILNFSGGLQSLVNISVEEIQEIKGVGLAKGAQLNAVIELSKRLFSSGNERQITINNPAGVSNLVMSDLRYMKQEVFKLILLDSHNKVIAIPEITRGGLTSSIVHPREVFREAIRRSSAAIILVHNHPSGLPDPSEEDINITGRLIEAGEVIGIEVLDHLIIGDGVYVSMKEEGFI